MKRFSILMVFVLLFAIQIAPAFSMETGVNQAQEVCDYGKTHDTDDDTDTEADQEAEDAMARQQETRDLCAYGGKHDKDDKQDESDDDDDVSSEEEGEE